MFSLPAHWNELREQRDIQTAGDLYPWCYKLKLCVHSLTGQTAASGLSLEDLSHLTFTNFLLPLHVLRTVYISVQFNLQIHLGENVWATDRSSKLYVVFCLQQMWGTTVKILERDNAMRSHYLFLQAVTRRGSCSHTRNKDIVRWWEKKYPPQQSQRNASSDTETFSMSGFVCEAGAVKLLSLFTLKRGKLGFSVS